MKRLNPINWWKDLSVSKKLYGVVGVMAILIATELFTLIFAMNILSSVRAFVGGEGLWSKAQKNALFELQKYVSSHEEADYKAFRENLTVNLGDRKARLELNKANMSVEAVTLGFIEGKNHPQDVPSMIHLMRRFNRVTYIHQAIEVWGEADSVLNELDELGVKIHEAIYIDKLSTNSPKQKNLVDQLSQMNRRLTTLEDRFSYILGEGSRWLEHRLMFFLMIAVFAVEGTGLFLTITFARSLVRLLSELNEAANEIGNGNFNKEVPARSRDELGQLAISLNKMTANLHLAQVQRQQATEASESKSLFLANMSHEIRTPLGAMLGFVDLLRDPTLQEQERQNYLNIVLRTGESLATIINDILDISKIEAGKLEVSPSRCHLGRLLKDLQLLLQLRCDHKGIQLNFIAKGKIPNVIKTDGARLRQILLNVIGNSIKFTSRGGVDVFYRVHNGVLEFAVHDSGIGISPRDKLKLFHPFSQGDLSIRKIHGGTGLGLVLSRKLAELLGGDVLLQQSEINKGSIFIVKIKLERFENENLSLVENELSPKAYSSLRGKKILLVEDNPDNQLLIHRMLLKSGVNVEIASNGLEGVQKALEGNFDLVLMDMQMPILDGYSATSELRKLDFTTPIIGLTAHAMKEDIDKSLAAGCNAVLTKPFKIDDLVATVGLHCAA